MLLKVPSRSRRLSNGVLVEASILARVLSIKLLTLDATVAILPAEIEHDSTTDAPRARPRRLRAGGPRLSEATRTIGEGAALLESASRGAQPGTPQSAEEIRS